MRARLQRWFESRLPLSDSVTLTQRNVYILPTRPGLVLAATLLLLLVASINYQLNLGYLLTFLLAGSALVGMHVSHGTLRGLNLRLTSPRPAFASTQALLDVVLSNDRPRPRYSVGLCVQGGPGQPQWVWADVPAAGSATLQLGFAPATRGRHRVPTLSAETRFPLGTFRVWTVWRPAAHVLVYPAPEAHPPPLPPGQARPGKAAMAPTSQAAEPDGVRPYRRGDSLQQVAWKKSAQTGTLISREASSQQGQELWLDLEHAGLRQREAQLSRLCAWVLMADRLGLSYGLRLPGLNFSPASGEAHRLKCLEALALCGNA